MPEYLDENDLFSNKKIVKRKKNILTRYFPKDISNIIIEKIYRKCNNLRTLSVPYQDFKEFFYDNFTYEKEYEDEIKILSVNYDKKNCNDWEYNISWKSYYPTFIGRIENINSSSPFALNSCSWDPYISSDNISDNSDEESDEESDEKLSSGEESNKE